MPVLGILASSKLKAAATSFESIATVTVGSGGAANVEFTSIGTDWTHLQIRWMARTGSVSAVLFTFNNDTGSNYSGRHRLGGDGATASASGLASQTRIQTFGIEGLPTASNTFGVGVADILDYRNTNKYKTFRQLCGGDANGSGQIELTSGAWMNTNAITSIKIAPDTSSFAQYSHFALYGIKSA